MLSRDTPIVRLYYRLIEVALLGPLSRVFSSPDRLTLAGAAVSALVPLGFYLHPALGLGVLLASAVFDSLDGMLARKTGQASRFGAFLDSSLDRVSDFFYLAGFWVLFVGRPHLTWASLLTMAALTATLLISYVKARAEGLGGSCEAGLMERAPRVIYLAAWALALIVFPSARGPLLWWGLSIYTALTALTVVQRIKYVLKTGLGE